MILDYNRKPDATVDEKIQSLMENTQLALNDISRAQQTADVAKDDAQTSVALSQTARQAAADASDAAATAKRAADDATAAVLVIEGDVSGLTTRVAQAESDIDAAEGNITSLTGRVADAEGDITTIEGNVSSLTGRVADAEADISTAEGNISTLQSDVSTAQGNISTIQGNITNLSGRVSDAESDITTVEGNITTLSGRVSDAEEDVEDVMKGLALAEDVVGTLNWITAHSTVTTDTVPDPDTKYYIKHLDGTFEFVTDTTGKNPAQEGWYVLDEALQNYVLSHLALTNEGLKVMKDGSEWKVLIGDDGVYILDPNNDPANQMTGDGNIIGYNGESRVEIDYHSLQLIDKDNNAYVHFSDLRDTSGYYESVETFIATSGQTNFETAYYINSPTGYTPTVTVNDVVATVTIRSKSFVLDTPATADDVVQIVYKTADAYIKAYTLGMRSSGSTIGAMSCAEGIGTEASGEESHAEGFNTTASGKMSHAEGYSTEASGSNSHAEGYGTEATGIDSHAEGYDTTASGTASHAEGNGNTASGIASHAEGIITTASGTASHAEGNGSTASGVHSHAQNYGTVANRKSQTVLGEFNIADNQGANESVRGRYAVIVGNGTSVNARSNAFTVDWDGNVEADGDLTDGRGNVLSDMISKSSILDFCHPVWSTYSTLDPNFDPNVSWGGTWERLPEGYVLLSGDDDPSSTYKVGTDTSTSSGYKEYGANTKNITVSNMPSHDHAVNESDSKYFLTIDKSPDNAVSRRTIKNGTGSNLQYNLYSENAITRTSSTGSRGSGSAFNVMQKSIAVYWWIRTA